MTLTQITEHSLTKTNCEPINLVKIPTIELKFPPSPRLPISSSLFFQNETALPVRGERKNAWGLGEAGESIK